jgi:SAM-dependent methyltransferase
MSAEVVDATDLSRYESESFEAVLCLGPMYHLKKPVDQKTCIEECLRVLKPNGILAVAYVNRYFLFPYLVSSNVQFLDRKWITRILEEGQISSNDNDCFWTDAYFHTPSEIEGLFLDYNVEKLENVATDGIGIIMKDQINKLTEEEFDTWVEYHLKTCNEQSILGMSNHGMYVCRKN